jgi:hypothetical protein
MKQNNGCHAVMMRCMYGMWPWVATFSKPPFGGARMKNKFKMKIKDKIQNTLKTQAKQKGS